jgi:hypothetical protein
METDEARMLAAKRFDNRASFVLGTIVTDHDFLDRDGLGSNARKLLVQKLGAVKGAHRY